MWGKALLCNYAWEGEGGHCSESSSRDQGTYIPRYVDLTILCLEAKSSEMVGRVYLIL